eukprot:2445791-Pleurochrysis_carterae.AAC.3
MHAGGRGGCALARDVAHAHARMGCARLSPRALASRWLVRRQCDRAHLRSNHAKRIQPCRPSTPLSSATRHCPFPWPLLDASPADAWRRISPPSLKPKVHTKAGGGSFRPRFRSNFSRPSAPRPGRQRRARGRPDGALLLGQADLRRRTHRRAQRKVPAIHYATPGGAAPEHLLMSNDSRCRPSSGTLVPAAKVEHRKLSLCGVHASISIRETPFPPTPSTLGRSPHRAFASRYATPFSMALTAPHGHFASPLRRARGRVRSGRADPRGLAAVQSIPRAQGDGV